MTHVNFAMTTLLNGVLEGTLLAVAMWLFLKLLPRLNPTTRFTVLWATLFAIVVLLLEPFTPGAFLPGTQTDSHAITATKKLTLATLAPVPVEEPKTGSRNPNTSSRRHPVFVPKSNPEPVSNRAADSVEARSDISRSGSIAIAAVEHPLIRIHSGRILGALEFIWAFLSLAMLMRLGFGYSKLRGLKAEATPAPVEWQLRLRTLRGINGVRRQTQLLVSSHIAAPMSLGFLNPAILIPQALIETLSDAELEHVVLHELGHLLRRDDWTNLAQKLIEAMLPIQPAVYWIGHRMSIEREMACDDWVIAATGTAEPYAASLTRVAELSQWARAGILAAGATGNRSQLFSRVHHMLDRTRNAAPRLAFGQLGLAIAAIGILLYASVRAPQMIAFAQTSAAENSPGELATVRPSHPIEAPQAPIPASVPGAPFALPASQTPTSTISATFEETPASPLPPSTLHASSAPSPSPSAPITPIAPQQSSETHMEMTTTHNGFASFRVKIDGAIEFTDDDGDVKSLSVPAAISAWRKAGGFPGACMT
jgi:beta-lactamase regulating signal transducer with metallopeptidase domain